MIDALQVWKDELEDLPKVADSSWAANFAAWTADRTSASGAVDGIGIESNPAFLDHDVPPAITFTFAKAIFEAELVLLNPTTDDVIGITGFATAWETAILASLVVTKAGSFKPPKSASTTFSAVASTTIDGPSILAGKSKILELIGESPVIDPQDSRFPEKFRDAFLLLTITVTGTNSSSPDSSPLTVAAVPLM